MKLSDWLLLARCAALLGAVRAGTWVVPVSTLRKKLLHRGWLASPPSGDIDRIAWAVRAASRCVPGATCLVQALALEAFAVRCGLPTRLCIGVSLTKRAGFLAHAWLESGGRILIGEAEAGKYTPLVVWEGEAL